MTDLLLQLLVALISFVDVLVLFAGLFVWGAFIFCGLVMFAERIIHRDQYQGQSK